MRIGINARCLQDTHDGIENYLLNILLNLKGMDRQNQYVLFFESGKPVPEAMTKAGFEFVFSRIPAVNQVFWSNLCLAYEMGRSGVDLFHEPSFIAPVFKRRATIITVYDVAFIYFPFCYTRKMRLYFNALLSLSIRQSDSIIAISESTKRDIVDKFKISPDRIHTIYAGVSGFFRTFDNKERMEAAKKIYGIRGDFILNVGGMTPRKNLVRLIKAFKLLKERKKSNIQLAIVGRNGWLCESVFREVAASGMEEDVIFCGYVPPEHLLCLYNAASVFAYPSLYEGFGLPILEAMACGCPVIASNTSSMPEVCGKAALLINPEDVGELAHAMYRLMSEDGMVRDLINKGKERVKVFSWEKAAGETIAVYNKIGSSSVKK